jgi:hypothetical protein
MNMAAMRLRLFDGQPHSSIVAVGAGAAVKARPYFFI